MHRGMGGRKAVGLRVRAHIAQAKRARIVDQHAEDSAPARQVADRAVGLLVDAACQEALELLAPLVEHADRRVPRSGELLRDLPARDRGPPRARARSSTTFRPRAGARGVRRPCPRESTPRRQTHGSAPRCRSPPTGRPWRLPMTRSAEKRTMLSSHSTETTLRATTTDRHPRRGGASIRDPWPAAGAQCPARTAGERGDDATREAELRSCRGVNSRLCG